MFYGALKMGEKWGQKGLIFQFFLAKSISIKIKDQNKISKRQKHARLLACENIIMNKN